MNVKKIILWSFKMLGSISLLLFSWGVFIETIPVSVPVVVSILGMMFSLGITLWFYYAMELLIVEAKKGWKV